METLQDIVNHSHSPNVDSVVVTIVGDATSLGETVELGLVGPLKN